MTLTQNVISFFCCEYIMFCFKLRSYSVISFSHVDAIPGSRILVWVKVVSVPDCTSYKWDASPLFLTRWQHSIR